MPSPGSMEQGSPIFWTPFASSWASRLSHRCVCGSARETKHCLICTISCRFRLCHDTTVWLSVVQHAAQSLPTSRQEAYCFRIDGPRQFQTSTLFEAVSLVDPVSTPVTWDPNTLLQIRAASLQELVYKQGQAGINKATVSITFRNDDPAKSPQGYEDKERITITRQVRNMAVYQPTDKVWKCVDS